MKKKYKGLYMGRGNTVLQEIKINQEKRKKLEIQLENEKREYKAAGAYQKM